MNEWNSRAVSLNITSHPAYTRTGPGTHTRGGPPAHACLLARSLALQEGPVTHTSGLGWLWEAPQSEELGSTRTPGYSSLHQRGAPQGCMPDTRCLPGGAAPSVVSTCLTLSPQITGTPPYTQLRQDAFKPQFARSLTDLALKVTHLSTTHSLNHGNTLNQAFPPLTAWAEGMVHLSPGKDSQECLRLSENPATT